MPQRTFLRHATCTSHDVCVTYRMRHTLCDTQRVRHAAYASRSVRVTMCVTQRMHHQRICYSTYASHTIYLPQRMIHATSASRTIRAMQGRCHATFALGKGCASQRMHHATRASGNGCRVTSAPGNIYVPKAAQFHRVIEGADPKYLKVDESKLSNRL